MNNNKRRLVSECVYVSQHNYSFGARAWNTETRKEGRKILSGHLPLFASLSPSIAQLNNGHQIHHTLEGKKKKRKEGQRSEGSDERGGRRKKCEYLHCDTAQHRDIDNMAWSKMRQRKREDVAAEWMRERERWGIRAHTHTHTQDTGRERGQNNQSDGPCAPKRATIFSLQRKVAREIIAHITLKSNSYAHMHSTHPAYSIHPPSPHPHSIPTLSHPLSILNPLPYCPIDLLFRSNNFILLTYVYCFAMLASLYFPSLLPSLLPFRCFLLYLCLGHTNATGAVVENSSFNAQPWLSIIAPTLASGLMSASMSPVKSRSVM